MKHFFFFLLIMFIGLSCKAQSNNTEYYRQTEMKFAKAIQGTPLVIPLIDKSDATIFLMPVADTRDGSSTVDRVYLVDGMREEFVYERDIYRIDRILKINDTENFKYVAVVNSIMDGSQHEYEIDAFMYRDIKEINNGRWNRYPSNVKISVISVLDKSCQSEEKKNIPEEHRLHPAER